MRGKNPKRGEKTVQDAYVPERVKENLDRYASERRVANDEPYVSASVSTVRRWIREPLECFVHSLEELVVSFLPENLSVAVSSIV